MKFIRFKKQNLAVCIAVSNDETRFSFHIHRCPTSQTASSIQPNEKTKQQFSISNTIHSINNKKSQKTKICKQKTKKCTHFFKCVPSLQRRNRGETVKQPAQLLNGRNYAPKHFTRQDNILNFAILKPIFAHLNGLEKMFKRKLHFVFKTTKNFRLYSNFIYRILNRRFSAKYSAKPRKTNPNKICRQKNAHIFSNVCQVYKGEIEEKLFNCLTTERSELYAFVFATSSVF
ncbi:MAG: hypothetical protein Q4E16_02665 [Neisseria sp.]|nr:hypothetical protein [Neisseria sp.]